MKPFSTHSFIAGMMLGALLVGAYFLGSDSASLLASTASFTATSTELSAKGSDAISVVDQPAGDTVMIESIAVPLPRVWVAVREVQGNDLGNVLGATRVNGSRNSVSISLLRATTPNHSYAIELYRDDGNDVFDLTTNSVYVDFDTGAPVISYFTTTN